jgi:hypothetical protein
MTKTIEQIEAEALRHGIRLTSDPKTLAAAREAHDLGRHVSSETSFAPLCEQCFATLES